MDLRVLKPKRQDHDHGSNRDGRWFEMVEFEEYDFRTSGLGIMFEQSWGFLE